MPVDRGRLRPATLNKRKILNQWSEDDERILQQQLGFVPGNAVAVRARASKLGNLLDEPNDPIVIQLYPLVLRDENEGSKSNGKKHKSRKRVHSATDKDTDVLEPFPTTFWVTHPFLRVMISRLEVEGFGVELQERLAHQPEYAALMAKAHAQYGQDRWKLLTEDDLDLIHERKWEYAVDATNGVAGIRNFAAIKCLHAHAAHYLAGCHDNIVGKWAVEALLKRASENPVEEPPV